MATATRLSVLPLNEPGANAINQSAYISSRLLAANVAESITVPAGVGGLGIAGIVRIVATADIYINFAGAAAVPGDIDDGTACELIKSNSDPEWRYIPPGTVSLSVISQVTPIVTASFYVL